MPPKGDILLEYDKETREYLAVWEPVILGLGRTEREALKDMIAAAELFIDTNKKFDDV